MWAILGQGLNLSHSCNLCHSYGNDGFLNTLLQGLTPCLWRVPSCYSWILDPLCHSRNSLNEFYFFKNFLEVPVVMEQKQIQLVSWGLRFDPWHRSVRQGSHVAVSCGVGHRSSLDLALLWLWCSPAIVALIWLLVWKIPYVKGVALKSKKKKKKKKILEICKCV